MAGIRDLKRRIKSVASTRKITHAMELVSGAKMKRAQNMATASRTYAESAWGLVQNLAHLGAYHHPLIKIYPRANKVGVILLTTNRGLVGSLNTNVLNKLRALEKGGFNNHRQTEVIAEIITYGRKGSQALMRLQKNVIADFPKLDRTISSEDIYPMAQMITQMYASGKYRKIFIVFNTFVSTLVQAAVDRQILPFHESIREELVSDSDEPEIGETPYIFEPDTKAVLSHLLPRIVESQIYRAIVESDASEHSARMVMMKNATEAAGDIIADLTLTYNQLRQNKITTELAEITAGKIALE